jgi:hypothetical protein
MSGHLANITYRLRQQRERLEPGQEMRRRFLERGRHSQLRSEKEAIQGHISRLQPGVRLTYLRKRLQQLKSVKR